MTSPRRPKKSGAQCSIQSLDWDSSSADTGTVKRRSSCPETSGRGPARAQEAILEVETPSDSGSGSARSFAGSDASDQLLHVEQRISCIINENRSSKSNSESSDIDIVIDNILANPNDNDLFTVAQNETFMCERSKTFIKVQESSPAKETREATSFEPIADKKTREKRLRTPAPIKKLKTLDVIKSNSKSTKETLRTESKSSVLPIYKTTLQESEIDLSPNSQKKKVVSKLKLPFSPSRAMEKPKINFFQSKGNLQDKPSPLLSSPVRRTISNEYVRLKFTNDTVVRRTIDGKSVPKITPKIQSIIPESPVDNEDPFLNLSPNKKYTVTVNNRVRCDKDNYVIFDPGTGFKPEENSKSRIPVKSPTGEKSRIPMKSPSGDGGRVVARKSVNVSDTDSGILSPNSPVETSEETPAYYANAAAFSETAKRCAADLDIKILDPGLAKKAVEQIKNPSSNVLDDQDYTFKHYYYPISDGDDSLPSAQDEAVKRKINTSSDIDAFFDQQKAKKKKNVSSTVGQIGKGGGTSYISTNRDDSTNSTHLIKIEIYDMKKLAKVSNISEHWKFADVRVKYYAKEKEKNTHLQIAKNLIYGITKEIAESDECKKYHFNS